MEFAYILWCIVIRTCCSILAGAAYTFQQAYNLLNVYCTNVTFRHDRLVDRNLAAEKARFGELEAEDEESEVAYDASSSN